MDIVIFGAGRVGKAIVRDLAAGGAHRVTAVDQSPEALASLVGENIRTVEADLADRGRVAELAAEHEIVVGAGPAQLGFSTLETVIETGRNIVDISFFAEDPRALNAHARERGVVAVVDAGVSPGLSSVLYGHAAAMGAVRRFVCYVGGLPAQPVGRMQYRAPFAPSDVIELYTRPARHLSEGVLVTEPALAKRTTMTFPTVGTLEAALTDGLRTMLSEPGVEEMREMTLRYPGHFDEILLLRDLGLFDTSPLAVGDKEVSPRDVTERLLLPHWAFAPDETDLTILRVEIDVIGGESAGRYIYDMIDRHDAATGTSSMARTTGYTCTAIAELVCSGRYDRVGVSAPEDVGRAPGCCAAILEYLAERGVVLDVQEGAAP